MQKLLFLFKIVPQPIVNKFQLELEVISENIFSYNFIFVLMYKIL